MTSASDRNPAPAPAAFEPPEIGAVYDVRITVDEKASLGWLTAAIGEIRISLPLGILEHARLVSRPEKPLAVGEKALTGEARRVVEIVSIFERRGETFATVEITDRREYEVPFDTFRLADLRRAPEGT